MPEDFKDLAVVNSDAVRFGVAWQGKAKQGAGQTIKPFC